MAIKQGSMREAKDNVFQVLINDEELLRLLWYKPRRLSGYDPLDSALPNVKDMENYWDIVEERIMLAEKVNDLEDEPICRLYITSGRRRPKFDNYLLATQEIVISVYVHEDFELDSRMDSISDRINELLTLESFSAMYGKLDYASGNPRVAPIQYSRFEHIYEYNTNKK